MRAKSVHVEVVCRACGRKGKHVVPSVLINPRAAANKDAEWDGFLLERILECARCGAVDDYEVEPLSKAALVIQAVAKVDGVAFGTGALYDGTVVHRPSEAVAKLRARAAERPDDGEIWRRLGNACNRYGCGDEAESAWKRAVDVDPDEFEAALCLMERCRDSERVEAIEYLQMAIARFPRARSLTAQQRRSFAEALAANIESLTQSIDGPIALGAGWADGRLGKNALVRISSVDLRRVRDWSRLADFLASPDLHGAWLTGELPEDEYPQLEALLDGVPIGADTVIEYTPSQPFVRASPKTGRNDPCPCGSGKKFKRCCGSASAPVRRAS